MITSRYEDTDKTILNEWLVEQSMPEMLGNEIPALGLVALVEGNPVAAGFLRRCEGNLAIMDSFVTDPKAASAIRNDALNTLVEDLLWLAKANGIDKLMLFTNTASIFQRGEAAGFIQLDQTIMGKRI